MIVRINFNNTLSHTILNDTCQQETILINQEGIYLILSTCITVQKRKCVFLIIDTRVQQFYLSYRPDKWFLMQDVWKFENL